MISQDQVIEFAKSVVEIAEKLTEQVRRGQIRIDKMAPANPSRVAHLNALNKRQAELKIIEHKMRRLNDALESIQTFAKTDLALRAYEVELVNANGVTVGRSVIQAVSEIQARVIAEALSEGQVGLISPVWGPQVTPDSL